MRKVESRSVHANGRGGIFKDPTGRDWVATEYVCKNSSKRIADDEGKERPYGDNDVSTREDAQVEEQDASFGKTGSGAEENGGEKVPLQWKQSVSVLH